ncbi:MAG: PadR family transcriptional regulator [Faecalibacillus faecis]
MAKIQKDFLNGNVAIKIISEGDCYGYQIVQTLDKISNGTIHIAEGTMYLIYIDC